MSKHLVGRANALVFGMLIGIIALVGALTLERFNAAMTARAWTQHSFIVIGLVKDLALQLRNAETGQRGFLLTGDDDYLEPYTAAIARIPVIQAELQRRTDDNPEQQRRLLSMAPLVQAKLAELALTIRLRRDEGVEPALRIVRQGSGKDLIRDTEQTLGTMSAEEDALLRSRIAARDWLSTVSGWLILAGVVVAIFALLAAARMLNRAWSQSHAAEAEQRSSALRLRSSLDSLSQGVAVFAADHRLTNWNDCFQILLDLPRAMVREGAPYAALAEHTAEAGIPLESEDQVLHRRTAPGDAVAYERRRANGHELEIRRTAMPDGGFVLTVSDMTRRAQSEAVLRESQKMQAIGQLTGGIAHDFNNLLTVILGNLEYVRGKLTGEGVLQTRIDRAAWAAGRGATLTGQLLAFARKQPLAPKPIDLTATLPDLVPILRRTLGEHIELRYVESAGLWPAMADPAQLESAVLNLALNARDAMPGGGRLTIELANKVLDFEYARAHSEVVAGDYTMVAVSDTGHGMTSDIAARVFEPFFTTKPDGRGTGLGLAMVFGFVKQSGGHVKIYTEPGEGTTVRIYLPRANAAAAALAPKVDAPIDLPRGSATILVVEDEPAVREVAVSILTDLGYRVLEAGDGEDGLRVFGQHAPAIDMLLTDVVLPGRIRGRELAERITAMRPEIRVLYMSGYTENSIVHHGRLDDGVQLVSKPFKRDHLARKVAEALEGLDGPKASNVVDLRTRHSE